MMSAFNGIIPAVFSTCSAEGVPNVTFVSQVYYVDDEHVAVSWQFMNKTARNLTENPYACVVLTSPETYAAWKLHLRMVEKQTEGPIFDRMDMQLQALTALLPTNHNFKILAAVICKIEAIEQLYTGSAPY